MQINGGRYRSNYGHRPIAADRKADRNADRKALPTGWVISRRVRHPSPRESQVGESIPSVCAAKYRNSRERLIRASGRGMCVSRKNHRDPRFPVLSTLSGTKYR
jgi:hypothetical protein